MGKSKNLYHKLAAKVSCALFTFTGYIAAKKATIASANYNLDWLTKDDGNDMFGDVTKTVKSGGNSIYKLLLAVGAVGLLVALVGVGISFAMNKSAQKKEENKSHLLSICIGGVIVFGAMFIIGLISNIGGGLSSSDNVTPTP